MRDIISTYVARGAFMLLTLLASFLRLQRNPEWAARLPKFHREKKN